MSLAFRLIARLDIKAPDLIKTVRLEGVRKVGDPAAYARRYDRAGIDEILYLDVVASLYGRSHLPDLLAHTTNDIFVPVCCGGGVSSVDAAAELLRAGADKVAVNTAALKRPELITEISRRFGSQAMVIQIDAKKLTTTYEAYGDCGRERSGRDVVAWAQEACDRGAGEVVLTAVDREGTGQGFDTELVWIVASSVGVPVLASGGFGAPGHASAAAAAGASGVVIADALHYEKVPLGSVRNHLKQAGYTVRPHHEEAGAT